MALQVGPIYFVGTIGDLTYYKMGGKYYVRQKSSLTAKKVKTSPRFKLTRLYTGFFGKASKITSGIYRSLPRDWRQYWMFRSFTGEAMQMLKIGKEEAEIKAVLFETYVQPVLHGKKKPAIPVKKKP